MSNGSQAQYASTGSGAAMCVIQSSNSRTNAQDVNKSQASVNFISGRDALKDFRIVHSGENVVKHINQLDSRLVSKNQSSRSVFFHHWGRIVVNHMRSAYKKINFKNAISSSNGPQGVRKCL